jgi:hypothetical protein
MTLIIRADDFATGHWFVNKRTSPFNSYQLLYHLGRLIFLAWDEVSGGSIQVEDYSTLIEGEETHVGITFDNLGSALGLNIYINGQPSGVAIQTTNSPFVSITDAPSDMVFGTSAWNLGWDTATVDGFVNCFKQYKNRVLTDAEMLNVAAREMRGEKVLLANYYPLKSNSNESFGATSGIDGVDTGVTYDGTYVIFAGNDSSYIEIPDNNIFSFTDGVIDLHFSIEVTVNFTTCDPLRYIHLVNKRSPTEFEWQLMMFLGRLRLACYDNVNGGVIIKDYFWTPTLGQDYSLRVEYDGSGTPAGIKFFIDNVNKVGIDSSGGTYVRMRNTSAKVTLGVSGTGGGNLWYNGKMRDLQFNHY